MSDSSRHRVVDDSQLQKVHVHMTFWSFSQAPCKFSILAAFPGHWWEVLLLASGYPRAVRGSMFFESNGIHDCNPYNERIKVKVDV
jgi:hypothetical protein